MADAKQIYRTLKPGGTATVTLWKMFGFKPILWEVQERVKPANPLTELPLMEPWCDPKKLEKVLTDGGFGSVEFSVVKEGMWGKDHEGGEGGVYDGGLGCCLHQVNVSRDM